MAARCWWWEPLPSVPVYASAAQEQENTEKHSGQQSWNWKILSCFSPPHSATESKQVFA